MIWSFFLIDFIYFHGWDMRTIQPPNLAQVVRYKEILIYFLSIKSFLYFTAFVFTIIERNHIMKEIMCSIYKEIDTNLNEDLFNNMINQCKNPSNNKLKREYSGLLNKSSIRDDETIANMTDSDNNLNKHLLN